MSTWRDQADAFAYATGGVPRDGIVGGKPHKGPRLEMAPLLGVWCWLEAPETIEAIRKIVRGGGESAEAIRAKYYQLTGVDLGR